MTKVFYSKIHVITEKIGTSFKRVSLCLIEHGVYKQVGLMACLLIGGYVGFSGQIMRVSRGHGL